MNKLILQLAKMVSEGVIIVLLSALSLYILTSYIHANYLNAGYFDWMVHAFRIKLLNDFGFTSWTHIWSSGISIWKAYQFVPHFLTLAIVKAFKIPIPRAMVVMTIIQFVLLHVSMYCVLRFLKFSRTTAAICSLLTFDISHYWGAVGDFSLMFGVTLFPWVIYLWTKYYQEKLQYLFPYLIGLTFYVHPLLGISSLLLWIIGLIFSNKRIFSLDVYIQFLIFLISSSLFWFPIVFKTSYSYTSGALAGRDFLLRVIDQFQYLGLGLYIYGVSLLALFGLFYKSAKREWAHPLTIFSIFMFAACILSISVDLPRVVTQFQYTRAMSLIGIAIIFAASPIIEKLLSFRKLMINAVIFFCVACAYIEGVWFASEYYPRPVQNAYDPVSVAIKHTPAIDPADGRIWTSTVDTASYFSPTEANFPFSYMGQLESNEISQRLNQLAIYNTFLDRVPPGHIERLSDYFYITGTKYIFIEEGSRLISAIKAKDIYDNLGSIEAGKTKYILFEARYPIFHARFIDKHDAFLTNHFPFDLEFANADDQIKLDSLVHQYVQHLQQDDNRGLSVQYTSQETIEIPITATRGSNSVYLDESYDSTWNATFNGITAKISPVGPNYMIIDLPPNATEGTLKLRHTFPYSFYIGLYGIILIPLIIMNIQLLERAYNAFKKRKK